jgi:hypothetical protein
MPARWRQQLIKRFGLISVPDGGRKRFSLLGGDHDEVEAEGVADFAELVLTVLRA